MKFLPKVLASFILVAISFVFISPVLAQGFNSESTSSTERQTILNSPSPTQQDLHTYTQSVIMELLGATTCQLAGINATTKDTKCLAFDMKTGKLGYVENNGGGAIGMMGNLIGMTYDIPIATSDYIAYVGNNFGFTQKAYAQGVGFQGLTPTVKVWAAFRNIAYLLIVVAIVLIGLGIMFRLQLDARTVMSIQNQIPKLIITLLLITFSYAIAGFMIDAMWISTYVSVNVISQSTSDPSLVNGNVVRNLGTPPPGFADIALKDSRVGGSGILGMASAAGWGFQQIINSLFATEAGRNWTQVGAAAQFWQCANIIECIGQTVTGTIAAILSAVVGWILNWVIGVIAILIIFIAILVAMFRLWFALIKAYIFILVNVTLAPFWIISGLIPGGAGFGGWLRDLAGNLIAFPVAISMFLLARVYVDIFATAPSGYFVPPLIGNPGSPEGIGGFIAMGIILIAPEAVTMARDFIKSPQFKYTTAIGTGLGVGQSMAGGFVGGLTSRMFYTDRMGVLQGSLGGLFRDQNSRLGRGRVGRLVRWASRANTGSSGSGGH